MQPPLAATNPLPEQGGLSRIGRRVSLCVIAVLWGATGCGGKVLASADTSQTSGVPDAGVVKDSGVPKDTSSIPDLGPPDTTTDTTPAEFCSGQAKLQIGSKLLSPLTVTSTELLMNCCVAYGARLHVGAEFGEDISLGIVAESGGSFDPGKYVLSEAPGLGVYVALDYADHPIDPQVYAQGTLELLQNGSKELPVRLSLCLRVADDAGALAGLRLYLPELPVATSQWNDRLELRLLKDPAITAAQVSSAPLSSLELSAVPIANLGEIAYYRQSTHTVFWSTSVWSPVLPNVGPEGVPFVVLVDGARIYLGAFASQASSAVAGMPVIYMEQMTATTTTVSAPSSGPDPRSDPRILGLLSESQRLIP